MACGLHQIDTTDIDSPARFPILGPPDDLIELGERIHVFWALYTADQFVSLTLGKPSAAPSDHSVGHAKYSLENEDC